MRWSWHVSWSILLQKWVMVRWWSRNCLRNCRAEKLVHRVIRGGWSCLGCQVTWLCWGTAINGGGAEKKHIMRGYGWRISGSKGTTEMNIPSLKPPIGWFSGVFLEFSAMAVYLFLFGPSSIICWLYSHDLPVIPGYPWLSVNTASAELPCLRGTRRFFLLTGDQQTNNHPSTDWVKLSWL